MSLPLYFLGSFNRQIPICQADRSVKSCYFSLFLPAFTHLFTVLSQKRFHSRYNFGYGILLYIRKMPLFHPKTALFGGSRGVFSYINDKSAILCPTKTEVADFVSFKGSIVHRISIEKDVEIWYN